MTASETTAYRAALEVIGAAEPDVARLIGEELGARVASSS